MAANSWNPVCKSNMAAMFKAAQAVSEEKFDLVGFNDDLRVQKPDSFIDPAISLRDLQDKIGEAYMISSAKEALINAKEGWGQA